MPTRRPFAARTIAFDPDTGHHVHVWTRWLVLLVVPVTRWRCEGCGARPTRRRAP